jgi:hypothetical protein
VQELTVDDESGHGETKDPCDEYQNVVHARKTSNTVDAGNHPDGQEESRDSLDDN